MRLHFPHLLIAVMLASPMVACEDTATGPKASDVEARTAQDIDANGKWAYFSLKTGEIVPPADSNSTKWDLAFNNLRIVTNSGSGGPGNGGAIRLDLPFEEVKIAPSEGYVQESATAAAIPTGSGNGWYVYNHMANVITPIPNRTFVVRTGDGLHFAKIQILSYYRGNPTTPTSANAARFYTFRYVVQLTENNRTLE